MQKCAASKAKSKRIKGNKVTKIFQELRSCVGPGLITGAADDDPSGIGTYAVAGAKYGYAFLFMAPLSYPLVSCVEYICAKIGLVTGEGLAGVIRENYPKQFLFAALLILLVANTINAGTDIGAMAASINLLVPNLPIQILIVPLGLAMLSMQLFASYRTISTTFKWLTLFLFAYVVAAFFVKCDLMQVLQSTFIPQLKMDPEFITTGLAILGTTISPYLFFWQATEEVEEMVQQGKTKRWQRVGATKEDLKKSIIDIDVGMFVSVVVMYFIILTTAATLFQSGQTDIKTAADAAKALEPLAGKGASVLFALGIIGTGLLAVPVLTTSAAYALAEAFQWKAALDRKPWQAKEFYLAMSISMMAGLLINFIGIPPMTALFWTAVLNGLLAAPLLLAIMLISNNKKIMGKRVNSRSTNIVGWLTTAIMLVASITTLWTQVPEFFHL